MHSVVGCSGGRWSRAWKSGTKSRVKRDRLAHLFLVQAVFVTQFHTAVVRANCEAHELLGTGKVPIALASIVLVMADGLFGL